MSTGQRGLVPLSLHLLPNTDISPYSESTVVRNTHTQQTAVYTVCTYNASHNNVKVCRLYKQESKYYTYW